MDFAFLYSSSLWLVQLWLKRFFQAFQSTYLKIATTAFAERKRKNLGFTMRVSCEEGGGRGNQTQCSGLQ